MRYSQVLKCIYDGQPSEVLYYDTSVTTHYAILPISSHPQCPENLTAAGLALVTLLRTFWLMCFLFEAARIV